MTKYTFTLTFDPQTITVDTDDYDDVFAKSKDDLVDKINPTEVDDVRNWVHESWSEYELVDIYDLEVYNVKLIEST